MLSASGQSETRVATTQAVLCDALLTLAFASYHLSRRLFANSVSLVCAQQIVTTNVESEEAVRSICRSLTASVRQQPDRLDVCSILVVVVVLKAGLGFLYIRRRSVPNTESFVVTSIIAHCAFALVVLLLPYMRPSEQLYLVAFRLMDMAQPISLVMLVCVVAIIAVRALGTRAQLSRPTIMLSDEFNLTIDIPDEELIDTA